MAEASSSTVRGDAVDRRRFVPSPPCLSPGSLPPQNACPWNELSGERQRDLLPKIAEAIDAIHRFRVAHGALTQESVFVDGTTVWIAGVDAAWEERNEQGTPRERDLAWFRKECEQRNGPSVQPGIGRTCRGMLVSWREPPPARKDPTKTRGGRTTLGRTFPRRVRRRGVPWRMAAVILLVVGVVGGVAAWQLTPLPRYTLRTLRGGFRMLPASVRMRLDPDGRFDPMGRRLGLDRAQNDWTRLELGLSMQRPESIVRALTEPGDDYTELLRRFLRTNDAGFLSTLSSMYLFGGDWTPKAIPRLKELLGEDLPHGARRTLQFCFLRSSVVADLPTIESILQTPEHPDIIAEAHFALARLGRPAPIERLISACRDASYNAGLRFLATALNYHAPDDAHRFLKSYADSRRRKSLADAWHDVISVVELSPDGPIRERSSKIFERTLKDAIPKTLEATGPSADADLLMTLLCLWRLQTNSPNDVLKRLSAPTRQGDRIRARLSAMLVGDGEDPPDPLTLPDGWDVPDEWFAAVLGGSQTYPEPYVRKVLFNRTDLRDFQQESRLLALANIASETAREKLAADLSKSLFLYCDSWRTRDPHLISSSCALLAAARNETADTALQKFLAPGPYGREFPAWDGLIVGAIVDPQRHKELLKVAATHPLPTVWTRARQLLALAEGNVAAYRRPENIGPELPPALVDLVAQFESSQSEADVFVIITRQRAGQLADLALGLSGSPGAVAVLHARMDRRESPLETYLLLANQPIPLDRRRFDDFVHVESPYQIFDPPIMLGQVLRRDLHSLKTLGAIALGPRTSRNSPPLLHRYVAMECYGALQSLETPPETASDLATPEVVSRILEVIDRDSSVLVQHAAAAAALRCVKMKDKALLVDFASKRPTLQQGVADILNLAKKL